ncbi:nuclear envelope phosphatase-regulatory subunit 1 isoform X2 [Phoca vitulina]|uniref:nuclear envelope phosphatase-regulatory subunit 1 isoform X2 n=1 Tax=Phoca vitulina TaxID=9720 RepID=UPI00139651AE|nr:nuclear envelope phosphatase-regulatory subunit 1 isoform X2 [Phoca vitulina]
MNSLEQAEDLKAFERRLTEYIHCLQPATGRWRMLLIVVSVCTATGAWNWLIDPETQKIRDLIFTHSTVLIEHLCLPSTISDIGRTEMHKTVSLLLWNLQSSAFMCLSSHHYGITHFSPLAVSL